MSHSDDQHLDDQNVNDHLDDQPDDGYGAVLTPDWTERIRRIDHPADGSPVLRPDTATHGDGPPVVALHGVGNHAGILAPILPALAPLGPVVAPTLSPGLLVAAAERPDASKLLVDWLTAVERPPWQLVGHSMGGVIAGMLLRTRPELVTGAVLLNSPLPGVTGRLRARDTIDRTGRALLFMKALNMVTAFGLPRLPRLLRAPELAVVRIALRGFVHDPGAIDDRVLSRAVLASRTGDGSEFLRLARDLPDWEAEPFDSLPVTIVLGDGDPLVPPGDLGAVELAYPGATVHVVSRCGHFVHLEWPQLTVDTIRAALDPIG